MEEEEAEVGRAEDASVLEDSLLLLLLLLFPGLESLLAFLGRSSLEAAAVGTDGTAGIAEGTAVDAAAGTAEEAADAERLRWLFLVRGTEVGVEGTGSSGI